MAKLLIFNLLSAFFLLNSSVAAALDLYPFIHTIRLQAPAFGSDSIGFSQNNPGIAYVSISDGRVLKYNFIHGTFQDYAYTSSSRTKELCDGNRDASLAPICGKVFALSVDNSNQLLYLGDANLGLFVIPLSQSGLATFITNTADGQPLKLINGVDVDPTTGDVYFTDASRTLDYRDITPSSGVVLDSTGRLIKYNPKTNEVTVLLEDLYFPNGAAVSHDGTFVLIPLTGGNNIIKYYIKGLKAGTSEVLLGENLPGSPRKMKRASTFGHFWVAVNEKVGQPLVNKPVAYKFDSYGNVLITKDLSPQYPDISVTVIQETDLFTLFVGSRSADHITKYSTLPLL